MMWNAISNMIIKAADNINRGAETASKTESGSNGQNYQTETSDVSGGSGGGSDISGGYTAPEAQDTSAASNATNNVTKAIDNIKGQVMNNIGGDKGEVGDDNGTDENKIDDSDERLKNIFGDNGDAIKAFAKIKAIQFTYNDKAREIHPNGEYEVDSDPHYGVKAQDLAENPFTASAVEKDDKGYLAVNANELTMANSAVISEICKRIEIIEKVLGIKVV